MNRLKELRQEKRQSQKELAENIGVSYRTVQNWENGVNSIKPDKAQALADYFGVSVGYLLGYDEETLAVDHNKDDVFYRLGKVINELLEDFDLLYQKCERLEREIAQMRQEAMR